MSTMLCPHDLYVKLHCKKCSKNPKVKVLEEKIKELKNKIIELNWEIKPR
jgi:hypothetical protein